MARDVEVVALTQGVQGPGRVLAGRPGEQQGGLGAGHGPELGLPTDVQARGSAGCVTWTHPGSPNARGQRRPDNPFRVPPGSRSHP